MARWKAKFDHHPIHFSLDEFEEWFNQTQEFDDASATHELRRIGKVINELRNALNKADPETVPLNWLSMINDHLKNHHFIEAQRLFLDNRDTGHLHHINDKITNSVLEPLWQLKAHSKITAKESPLRGLEKMCDSLSSKIDKISTEYEEEIEKFRHRIGELEVSTKQLTEVVQQAEDKIKDALSDMERRFIDSETQRNEEFSTNQNARKDEFANDQRERKDQFSKWFKEFTEQCKSQLNEFMQNYIKTAKSSWIQTKQELDNIFNEAGETLKQINVLYGFTGTTTLSGQHLKVAKYEQRVAYVWSFFVFVFIVATLFWGFYVYDNGNSYLLDIPNMTFQLIRSTSITLVLLFGAFFCARQAASHSQSSKRTRWLGLQIHAINPYVHEFEPHKRGDFKDRIGDKLFTAHPEDEAHMRKAERVPSGIMKTIFESFGSRFKNE